jgi:hypothetical protein
MEVEEEDQAVLVAHLLLLEVLEVLGAVVMV